MSIEAVTLYFREGGSDKVYQASIDAEGDGYDVNFAFGKRGSTLRPGKKTKVPVTLDEAKKVYDKIVAEKMSGGYLPGSDDVSTYVPAESTSEVISACQLLEAIEMDAAETYLKDPSFWVQEKKDGERKMLQKVGGKVTCTNRKGKYCGFPKVFEEAISSLPFDVELDGESVGEVLYVFDILSRAGESTRELSYEQRLSLLQDTLSLLPASEAIQLVYTAYTEEEKRELLRFAKENDLEGVVFKKKGAAYKAGRAASGNSQFKLKLWESCSVKVVQVNDKRSVAVALLDGDKWVGVGNVTIPSNHSIPEEGRIIEVRYLYAHKGGSIYQSTYLGVRDDLDENECTITQLKYKPVTSKRTP